MSEIRHRMQMGGIIGKWDMCTMVISSCSCAMLLKAQQRLALGELLPASQSALPEGILRLADDPAVHEHGCCCIQAHKYKTQGLTGKCRSTQYEYVFILPGLLSHPCACHFTETA